MKRYPALVWQDHAGFFTAALVEDLGVRLDGSQELSAVAGSAQGALSQLSEHLAWLARQGEGLPDSTVQDPTLVVYTVPIRPEYEVGRRVYACDRILRLRIDCVHGALDEQMRLASLPRLGLRFHYFKGDALRDLVLYSVQEQLKRKTPQQVSRFLPPMESSLFDLVVKVSSSRRTFHLLIDDSPTLSAVADPLDDRRMRQRFNPAWERDDEVRDLFQRLGKERANVILVGDSGAGKTTLLAEAVRKIAREQPPPPHRYWLTSGQRIIAGMKYLGQWQERCEEIIEALEACDGVLCIENLLDLVRVGGRGPGSGPAAFFAPYLQAGELRMVAEATPTELDACRRLLPGFVDLFQVLTLRPFDRRRCLAIFERITRQNELNLRIEAEKGLIELIHQLFSRFFPYVTLPGRSVDFLQELYDRAAQNHLKQVNRQAAIERFISRTGLPEVFLRDDLTLPPEQVFDALTRDVIGQDHACRLVADIVATFKAGLNDPGRPVGVLLLCGPTGVGKTQLARSLSTFCFGHGEDKDRLIRLDMSEYATIGSAARLVGDPDAGGSELTKRVRQQPFVVLLFDEVEKAAPEVFDVLLNLLDEGRLSDAYGRLTDFRSVIVIMTSNLGAISREPPGFEESPGPSHDREVMSFFRPEFYNRIDEVVTFDPLAEATIHDIARKELSEIARREGLQKRGLTLEWTDAVVAHLAEAGFDKRYGARNLQRAIEELVVIPLARFLLERDVARGETLRLELDEQEGLRISRGASIRPVGDA